MNHAFNIIIKTRTTILNQVETLSLDQLNAIPAGFNNNILWNLGHMVAVQFGICYKRSGLPLPAMVSEDFFNTYKPGSMPERIFTAHDLDEIKGLLFTSIDQFEVDLQTDMFANYPSWTTRYGADIAGIDDVLAFLPFHEGLHIGAIIALKKLVVV